MNHCDVDDPGLATARDVLDFFGDGLESEDELRRALAGVHPDRVEPTVADKVVLRDGDRVLELDGGVWSAIFAATFGDVDVRVDEKLHPTGLDSLAETAARLGFKAAADRIGKFRAALNGMPFVKRADNSVWTPTPGSAVKVARPEDHEGQAAVAAEVSRFFGDADEDEPDPTLTITSGGRSVQVERSAFERLVASAGIQATADLNRQEFGTLISAARDGGNAGLLGALLRVRSDTSAVYKVRGGDGRSWKPAPALAAASENDRAAADIQSFLGEEN